jgi:hypothetical protein
MMMRTYLRLAVLLVLLAGSACAHNPIVVDTTIITDGDGVQVVVEIKQSEVLFAQHERRSLFIDGQDFARLEPAIGRWLQGGIRLSADGQPVPVSFDARSTAMALDDPLSFHLHGALPAGSHRLAVTITLFESLGGGLSIIDNVHLQGPHQQGSTIKPGETAMLDLSAAGCDRQGRVGTFLDFLRLGFFHIVPEGTDHILFVLGLFLLSPKLKPLLTQVTAFTIAHSLTLGLSLAGIFTLPSRIVEPMIAASIAVVAIENITTREVKPWRWMIVFAFGLVHGLGFAGALKDLHLPKGSVLKPLIGFNCGVELGQLTVIAGAAAVTWWCWKQPWYRTRVVVPASVMIAAIGLFWAVQRALGYGISP